jgi:hypothetical protein
MTYTAPRSAPPFGPRRRARWVASPGVAAPGLAARPTAGTLDRTDRNSTPPGRTDRSTTGVTR